MYMAVLWSGNTSIRIGNTSIKSSTQAISPHCLNVFTSNLIQRFLRGLGIFLCTALLKISASIKTTHNFFVTSRYFSAICLSIKTFLMLLTVTSIFNKAQPVLYTRVVVQWDGIGFWLEPCSNFPGNATIYGHKLPFFKHLSSLVQGISKSHNLHWTEQVQTILHSEFHSDWAYSGSRKGSDRNIALKWRWKIWQTSYISKTVPLAVFVQCHWYGYRWNRHFMFFSKIKVVVVINKFWFSPRPRYL